MNSSARANAVIRTILFVALGAFTACSAKFESEELTFPLQNNSSEALKLNGYFFRRYEKSKDVNILFLYRNGLIHDLGAIDGENLSLLTTASFLKKVKPLRTSWGVYIIDGDSLKFEKWYESGGPPKVAFIRSGVVLNDSTFLIQRIIRSHDPTEITKANELYHFRYFHPKPDSTNEFIK
jgi:hypothetical protein